jgi:hypothetical protein
LEKARQIGNKTLVLLAVRQKLKALEAGTSNAE